MIDSGMPVVFCAEGREGCEGLSGRLGFRFLKTA
jgi:hypothetical protein